jgi:SAM-dependent methyltransferase
MATTKRNDRSLAAIRRITRGQELGRILVLGAGGCRLAYDLQVQCGATATAVLDIDPFLLAIAEAVIRGAAGSLTETSVNAPEVDPVSRAWTLSAPSGPLGADVFHFFLADGTEPPFADQSFDTVVTPWFIDQVPTDLEAMLRRMHRLLVPGGRWINHGPLIYRPDALDIARWYARQEIFDSRRRRRVSSGRLGEHAAAPSRVAADRARAHRERLDVRGRARLTRALR